MGRNDRWRSSGPDANDVHAFLHAMAAHHKAACFFEIRASTLQTGTPRLMVKLVAMPGAGLELYRGPLQPCSVFEEWPNFRYNSLETLMYRLLWQMDSKLSSDWWENKPLPF